MNYSNKELYKISKKVFTEATLHQQIQAAGSNKAKFLEKVEKNKSNFGAQPIVMKILIAVYIIIFTAIPMASFMEINVAKTLPFVENSWNLFAGGMSLSGFLLMELFVLIIFSVTFTWGFLSKEPYKWVGTLPFSRVEVSKISFFTFLRGINVQIIVLSLVFPIGTMIGINFPKGLGIGLGRNFIMLSLCLVVNLAITIFNLSIVILLGRKMAQVMEGEEADSKMSNFIRIATIFSYVVFSMLASYTIQLAISQIPKLYDPANQFISTANVEIINIILSFIPFPFSGGYLLTSVAIGFANTPIMVIIGSSVGTILLIGLAFLTFRKALHILQEVASPESKIKRRSTIKKPITIEIKTRRPVWAYFRRDIAVITRELQTLTYMILPIMIPIMAALGHELKASIGPTNIPFMVIYIMSFASFSTFFIVMGVTAVETGGETITSSLPINIRDQIKAKIPFLFSTVPLMVLIAVMTNYNNPLFMDLLYYTLVLLPSIFILSITGLFLKIRFFGKFRHKYVIEEVNTSNKEWKIILILVLLFLLTAGFISTLLVGYWLTLTVEGISLILLLIIYLIMFPKKREHMSIG